MPTPHIAAPSGAFAETLLMPGDPLRAKHIAETFLTDARLVTDVRNMLGYTGEYKGKRISVMGSGMGIPSCSIYAKELITEYGVRNLVRVGTCGGIRKSLQLRDIVIAVGASTSSRVNRTRLMDNDFAATADYDLLERAVHTARSMKLPVHLGNVFSSDLFYCDPAIFPVLEKMGHLAVEMEAAGLYGCAAEFGARAVTLLTVSDHIFRLHEQTSAEERQTSFNKMVELALDAYAGL